MANTTITTANTQYASYEEVVTVKTFTYTATVVTEAGESTATLTARQDLDCPRRREWQCPRCHSWMPMHYNINLQQYEPVHCTGCVIGLYDIQPAPAVVATPEPAVEAASIETSAPDEQDALIAELAFEADAVVDRERYFAARSGKYVLLHQRVDGLAVNCSCPSRVKRLRFQGKACKHMTAHNAMIKTAEAA